LENPNVLVFFVSTIDSRLQIVLARGTERTENMKNLIGSILPLLNGKGGGNDAFAQGGGEALMPAEKILDQLLTAIH
jgi:alanyl-tRNA synthetase